MLLVFASDSMNIGQIANLKAGGETIAEIAPSTYTSYHDTIGTQILHWSALSGLAKARFEVETGSNASSLGLSCGKTITTVQFRLQPSPRTVLEGWNRC
jgi:hypothetical protein